MATAQEHIRQARANRDHAEALLVTMSGDATALQWTVTSAFYCAVHCMNAHLASRNVQVKNHYERETELAKLTNGVPQDVYSAYIALKTRSMGARYWMWRFRLSQVRNEVLDELLAKVTAFVNL